MGWGRSRHSFLDHRYKKFEIDIDVIKPEKLRNSQTTKWNTFAKLDQSNVSKTAINKKLSANGELNKLNIILNTYPPVRCRMQGNRTHSGETRN